MADEKEMAMTAERLAVLVAAYGAAPHRWPAQQRAAAEALISRNPGGEALRHDARALDAILDRAAPVTVPASLAQRILAGFDEVAARPSVRRLLDRIGEIVWPNAPLWKPSAALAASLAAGLVLGVISPLGGAAAAPKPASSDMTIAFEAPQQLDLDGP